MQHPQCIWLRNCWWMYNGSGCFAKELRALNMRNTLLVIGSWRQQLRAIIEGDSVTTTWEAAKELNVDYSVVFWHLKQVGNVKKLSKWVPLELTKKKKNVVLKCHLLLFYTRVNHFSIGLWWEEVDCIWQPVTTSLEVGPRSSKVLLKAKLAPKKGHGHCSVVCSHLIQLSFLNLIPAKLLHLRSTLSESMRHTKNFNACSRHWSTKGAQFFSTMSDYTLHNQRFKSWRNWAT